MLALAPGSKVLQIIVRGSQSDGTVQDLGVIIILELQIESDKSVCVLQYTREDYLIVAAQPFYS